MECYVAPLSLLLLLSFQAIAEARYVLQVRVHRFSNPENRDWQGAHCDVDRSPCDVVFLFCLRTINWSPTSNLCPLGKIDTEGSPISASSRSFTIEGVIANGVRNPVTFTGTSSWEGSFQLMVRLDDDDSPDSNDLIDRVVVNMNLAVSDSFTSPTNYNGYYNRASMEMSFRVRCQTNYYGTTCNRLCVPRDDSGGHYTCDNDGNIVCLSGYTDTSSLCTTPVCSADECVQGTCSAPGECSCFTGWTGDVCDQCIPATDCINGYCMTAGDCICNEGYSGTLCQIDNDVCSHQQPCQNNGTCSNNGPDDYTCSCPAGITGADCEEDINECNNNPCENGATCTNTLGSFSCTCAVGWTGETCDDNIDECSSLSPCQNNATCTDCVPTGPGTITDPDNTAQSACSLGYMCECTEGFFGDNCETEEDYCTPSPCANGSTCHDIIGGPGYFCECMAGFTGENCEVEIDECQPNPCQNGGNCTDGIGSYTCDCAPGFTGAECHINIDDCASSPCNANNSHECVDGINSYNCTCIPGYTGQNCDSEFDKCTLDLCFNGATCQTLFNDFLCVCPTGFTGVQCDVNIDDCHNDLCLHGGTCKDEINNYTCTCLPKYTGRQCEINSPTCDDNPCGKEEFCVPLADGTFNCEPCINGEEGCKSIGGISPDQQIGNGTNTDNVTKNSIIGGVVGGVLGAILLLLLILILICCCLKCCPCCARNKEQETDVHYQAWSGNGVQENPIYFGTSTILSSQSSTMNSSTKGTMPRCDADNPTYRQDSLDMKTGSLQNPMYAIAQAEIQRTATGPPNLPPRNGSLSDSGSSTTTTAPLLAPPSSSNPSDGHYEQIPAANLPNTNTSPLVASGVYNRLKAEPSPSPEPEGTISGKYDRLTIPVKPPAENPYVVEPEHQTHDENPYTSTTRQAGRHKDDYFLLPTEEELKEFEANSSGGDLGKKQDVKESDLPPKVQNPYDI